MKHSGHFIVLVQLTLFFCLIDSAPIVRIRSGVSPSTQIQQATDTSCTATAQVTNKTTGVVSSVGTVTYELQGNINRLAQSGINIEFSFTYAENLGSKQFIELFTSVLCVSQDYIIVFEFNVESQEYRILLRLLDNSEFTSQQLLNKLDIATNTQQFDNIHFYNVSYQIKNTENSLPVKPIEVPPPVLD